MARAGLTEDLENAVLVAELPLTQHRTLGDMNHRGSLSHSPGGGESAGRVSAGQAPPEGWEGEAGPGLSPWLGDDRLLSTSHHVISHVHVSLCPHCPYISGHKSYWIRAQLNDLFLTNDICNNPISKWGHVL